MKNESNLEDIQEVPLIDPTDNVLKHVEGAVKRLDDLQIAEVNRINGVILLNTKRLDDLRAAESRRVDEEAKMREDHSRELREAEAKRIDAIRAVDVNAVLVASERASAQATVLANQVIQSADALRNLVSSTAATMATQQDSLTKQFNDRISQVEKSQYENKGKSGVADPQLEELVKEVKALKSAGAINTGKTEGRSDIIGWIVGAVMLIIAALSLILK